MTPDDRCKNCGADLDQDSPSQDAEFCAPCMRERIEALEDSLVKVGRLCLHTPGSAIWGEVEETVGKSGEKRWT